MSFHRCSTLKWSALRHALKQSRHWSTAWSMKLCWLLTTFQSDAISAQRHTSMVSDKHVPAFRFQSWSPGSGVVGVVFVQPGVKVWCILLWCLAVQQLLPDICQAAGEFNFTSLEHGGLEHSADTMPSNWHAVCSQFRMVAGWPRPPSSKLWHIAGSKRRSWLQEKTTKCLWQEASTLRQRQENSAFNCTQWQICSLCN